MGIRIGVVGGGIIGLAVARELLQRRPGADLVLFEKEAEVASHQTGRNSGVVHAGLYYEPGGLKATLCRRGAGLLRDYAQQHQVAYHECGKIVVAKNELERERLRAIYAKATANGVPGVRMINAQEIQDLEPRTEGVAALHSPETAIVDFKGVAEAIATELVSAGAEVRLSTDVTSVEEDAVTGTGRRVAHLSSRTQGPAGSHHHVESFDLVVVCAGLQSDRLARASGQSRFPAIVPFYGDYFMLAREHAAAVNGLIYPVPDPRYPFLGVHVTPRYDGEVMLGPNAFLSLGREIYRPRRASPRDIAEVVTTAGFWKFAAHNVPAMIRETRTALSRRAFVSEAQKYLSGIGVQDVLPGPRGVRAQAMHADGQLADDFVIAGGARVVHVRNAPSPGATSSLAIAEHIAEEALSRRPIA